MLLFPFRAQIKLHQWPVMTIAVAAVCLLIYAAQSQSDRRIEAHAQRVCAEFAKPMHRNRFWFILKQSKRSNS